MRNKWIVLMALIVKTTVADVRNKDFVQVIWIRKKNDHNASKIGKLYTRRTRFLSVQRIKNQSDINKRVELTNAINTPSLYFHEHKQINKNLSSVTKSTWDCQMMRKHFTWQQRWKKRKRYRMFLKIKSKTNILF